MRADIATEVATENQNRNSEIPQTRRRFTVAASVKTGEGFNDFLAALEDALNLLLKNIQVLLRVFN